MNCCWFGSTGRVNECFKPHIVLQKANYFDKKLKEEFKMTNKWLRWKETLLYL
jgi:hypothetical protein